MLAAEETFSFSKDGDPGVELVNFCPPEDGFAWSSGLWSEVKLPSSSAIGRERLGADRWIDIALDVDVFKAPPDFPGQNAYFYVNGLRLASRFLTRRVTVMMELPAYMFKMSENLITIETPDAARPVDHGFQDTRRLGIQLFSVRASLA